MSDNPAWLNEETRDSSPTEKLSDSNARPKSTSKVTGPKYKALVSAILTVFNCGCCVMMAATGALGVGAVDSEKDIGVVFVGLYMILFAAILFCYETIQIKPCAALDNFYKRNFGFLYGPMGKGLYMFFIAIIAFGLDKKKSLSIATGVVVAAVGCVQILMSFKFPEYFDVKEKYQP